MLLSSDVETMRCSTYVVISEMKFKYVYYITQIMGRCGIFHHSVKRAVGVVFVAKRHQRLVLQLIKLAWPMLLSFHPYKEGGGRLGKDVGRRRVSGLFWTELP